MATRADIFQAALGGFLDTSGNPYALGTLEFYIPGTATAKNAYEDAAKTSPVTSIALDASGRCEVYGDGWYKVILKNAAGATVDTFDEIHIQRPSFVVETKTADFTASTDVDLYIVDTTAGNVTVSLIAASAMAYQLKIVKKTADVNTVIIDPNSTETINGATIYTLSYQYQGVTVGSDGANLYTLSDFVAQAVNIQTAASTTVAGKVELATDAETTTGTDSARAVTPSSLQAKFASNAQVKTGTANNLIPSPASLLGGLLGPGGTSANDYITIPFRDKTTGARKELIIQIGAVSVNFDAYTITFPIAFPTACLQIFGGYRESDSIMGQLGSATLTATGATGNATGTGTQMMYYVAIGY